MAKALPRPRSASDESEQEYALAHLTMLASRSNKLLFPYWHVFLSDDSSKTLERAPKKESLSTLLLYHPQMATRARVAELLGLLVKDAKDFLSIASISYHLSSISAASAS